MRSATIFAATFVLAALPRAYGAEAPVAHWSFDEGRGETAKDRSGNGNDGKIHAAEWVQLKKGYALEFDGWTSYVDCGAGRTCRCRTA